MLRSCLAMRYSPLHIRQSGPPVHPQRYISFTVLTAQENQAMLVAMAVRKCSRYLALAIALHWRALVAATIIGLSISVMLCAAGCASIPSGQSLHEAATNAAPALIQGIETLRQVTALAGPSIWSELIPAACGLVIGAVGIWARITHGHVATLAAAVRDGQSNTTKKDNT